MSRFFIADTHFSDERILKYENRPFETVERMNQEMIRRWNDTVKDEDEVYLVGDVGDISQIRELNGKKYLIKGNHDTQTNEYYRQQGFYECYDTPIILDSFFLVSHEPLYVNENMPYANIFGHVHNSPLFKDFSKQHYCVSVERISYTPISFEKIVECVSK